MATRPKGYIDSVEAKLLRHLASIAGSDGIVQGQTYTQFGKAIRRGFARVRLAMGRLIAAGEIEQLKPAGGNAPATWHLIEGRPLVREPSEQRLSVSRREQRLVSDRLLARLLHFHGDSPPDKDAACAVEHWRGKFGARVAAGLTRLRDEGRGGSVTRTPERLAQILASVNANVVEALK